MKANMIIHSSTRRRCGDSESSVTHSSHTGSGGSDSCLSCCNLSCEVRGQQCRRGKWCWRKTGNSGGEEAFTENCPLGEKLLSHLFFKY